MLCGIKRRHPENNAATTTTCAVLQMKNDFVKRRCREENITRDTFQNDTPLPVSMETNVVTLSNTLSSGNKFERTSCTSSPPQITQRCLRCEAGEPGHIRHILK